MSEDPEAELMAQSVSRLGGIHQSSGGALTMAPTSGGALGCRRRGGLFRVRFRGLWPAVFRLKEVGCLVAQCASHWSGHELKIERSQGCKSSREMASLLHVK